MADLNLSLGIEFEDGSFESSIKSLKDRLTKLNEQFKGIDLKLNLKEAYAEIEKLRKQLKEVGGDGVAVKAKKEPQSSQPSPLDTEKSVKDILSAKQARGELAGLSKELEEIQSRYQALTSQTSDGLLFLEDVDELNELNAKLNEALVKFGGIKGALDDIEKTKKGYTESAYKKDYETVVKLYDVLVQCCKINESFSTNGAVASTRDISNLEAPEVKPIYGAEGEPINEEAYREIYEERQAQLNVENELSLKRFEEAKALDAQVEAEKKATEEAKKRRDAIFDEVFTRKKIEPPKSEPKPQPKTQPTKTPTNATPDYSKVDAYGRTSGFEATMDEMFKKATRLDNELKKIKDSNPFVEATRTGIGAGKSWETLNNKIYAAREHIFEFGERIDQIKEESGFGNQLFRIADFKELVSYFNSISKKALELENTWNDIDEKTKAAAQKEREINSATQRVSSSASGVLQYITNIERSFQNATKWGTDLAKVNWGRFTIALGNAESYIENFEQAIISLEGQKIEGVDTEEMRSQLELAKEKFNELQIAITVANDKMANEKASRALMSEFNTITNGLTALEQKYMAGTISAGQLEKSLDNLKYAFGNFEGSNPKFETYYLDEAREKIAFLEEALKQLQISAAEKIWFNADEKEFSSIESSVTKLDQKVRAGAISYKELQKQIELTKVKLDDFSPLDSNFDWSRVDNLREKLKELESQITQTNSTAKGSTSKGGDFSKVWSKAISKISSMFSKLKGIASKTFKKITSHSHKSSRSMQGGFQKSFKKLTKNLLRFGLGFRSMYFLVKRLRSSVISSFKDMVQVSEPFNKSVSNIYNSFQQAKNSIATAIQPLITTLEPVIVRLCNGFTELSNKTAEFFATLTGQNYIIKATKRNKDYAQSIREAEQALGAYDKLNVINKNDDQAADKYSVGDVEGTVSDFAKQLKDAWNKLDLTGLTDWGKKLGNTLASKLKNINWKDIQAKANTTMSKMAAIINGIFSSDLIPDLGTAAGESINTITQAVRGFVTTFDWAGLGTTFASGAENLITTVDWVTLGDTLGQGISGLFTTIYTFASTFDWKSVGDTLADGVNSLTSAVDWETVGNALGTLAKGLFDSVISFISTVDWVSLASGVATGLNSIVTSLTPTAEDIIAVTDAVKGLIDGFSTLLIEFDWSNLSTLLTTGINTIINALTLDSTSLTKVVNGINNVLDGLKTAVTTFDWKGLGEMLGSWANVLINLDWSGVGEIVSAGLVGIIDSFSTFLETADWEKIGQDIVDFITGINWEDLGDSVGTCISDLIISALSLMESYYANGGPEEILTSAFNIALGILKGIKWGDLVSKIFEFWGSSLGSMLSMWIDLATKAWDLLVQAWESLKSIIKKKTDEAGGNLIAGIFLGITDALKSVGNWIKEHIFKPFIQGFKDAFGIHSPSKKMKTMGGLLIDGLKSGLGGIWDKVKSKFTEWWTNLKLWFEETKHLIKKKAIRLISGMVAGIGNIWNKTKEKFTTMWTKLSGWFKTVKDKIKEKAAGWIENIKKGIGNIWNKVKTKFSDFKKNLKIWFVGEDGNGGVVGKIKKWFDLPKKLAKIVGNIWTTIKTKFDEFKTSISDWWQTNIADKFKISFNIPTWEDIKTSIKNLVNNIIDFLNNHIISGLNNLFSFNIPEWAQTLFNLQPSVTLLTIPNIPSIPLAKGAVIPPNKEFLATLGDQKHGVNIETPLDTMIEAFTKALDSRRDTNNPTVTLQVDKRVLYQAVWDENQKRYKQTGKGLA